MSDRLCIYPDDAGEWRWRLVAGNGRIIASSGEAFSSRWNAARAAAGANPEHEGELVVLEVEPTDAE